MRVAVTGAAGFLGRHLVARLAARGDSVTAIDLVFEPPMAEAECAVASVTDSAQMVKLLAGAEAVIHAAALTDLWHPDPHAHDRVNRGGTETTLAAAAASGAARAVLVSSYVSRLTGRRRDPPRRVAEDPVPPLAAMAGPYPRSKWLAERAAEAAALPIATVLPAAPFGPGDRRPTPPGAMLRDLANGALPAMPEGAWTFVDIRDLADAVLAALDRGAPGRSWLVGNETIGTDAFLACFAEVSGVPPPRLRAPWPVAFAAAAAGEGLARLTGRAPRASITGVRLTAPCIRIDSSRATAELGFRPRPLVQTLADALDWMAEQGMTPPRTRAMPHSLQ